MRTPLAVRSARDYNDDMKLKIHLEKDKTGYYVAECPALPGCVTQGKTMKEATENMKEAIECWLHVANRKGAGSKKKRTTRHVHV
jgi:predicted RNase H-like HicB family nuclease